MPALDKLAETRVDLVDLIERGIPDRQYIDGSNYTMPRAARLHIAADRKTGKSIVVGTVAALRIVKAGGSVSVLDRENGEDEYARRLASVLDAWNASSAFRAEVKQRYTYYSFPRLELSWGVDASYPEAFEHDDAVIFDSTRTHTSALGLKENDNDHYSEFATALIDPLWLAGKTTVMLDNTGWEGSHSRGASTKEDRCDVIYTMKQTAPFNMDERGVVELRVAASRFGEVHGAWEIEIGGGHYGQFARKMSEATKKTSLADEIEATISKARIEGSTGIARKDLAACVGRKSDDGTFTRALDKLVGQNVITNDGGTYSLSVATGD